MNEFDQKPKRNKTTVAKKITERWPHWWNMTREDGKVDMKQLEKRVEGWFGSVKQFRNRAAAEIASAAALVGRGKR